MYSGEAVTKAFVAVKEKKRITTIEMAVALKISRTSMGKIIAGGGLPSARLLVTFMNTYPEISLDWIFSGVGPMLKESSELEQRASEMDLKIKSLNKEVKTQKEFIDLLKDSRDMYREKIAQITGR